MKSETKEKYLEFKRKKSLKTTTYVGLSDDIAISIINALKKANLSQSDFAKKVGKTNSVISKWLNGQHNFTLKTIVDIENALSQKIIYPTIKINKESLLNKPVVIVNFDLSNKNSFSPVAKGNLYTGKKIKLSNLYTEKSLNLNC